MVASFKISSFHKKQVLDCGLLQQAVPLYIQRLKHARHCKFAVRILLVGIQSQSLWTSRPVMAAHSCGVLKEHFEKTRSLHRHDAEQRVWAVSNKLLQGKGLCIYKDIACKKASAYQNGTTKHCLQKLLHVSCQVRTSAEPEWSGVHRRQYGRSHSAAVWKQKAPPCRETPKGMCKANEGTRRYI